jgi:hypothetical protein
MIKMRHGQPVNTYPYIIKKFHAATVEISPIVTGLLETLDQVFQTDRTCHDRLDIEIPKGSLHWDSTEMFPNRDWGVLTLRISANRTLVQAVFPLRELSDLSEIQVLETSWDAEDASSAYEIRNGCLCLADAKQLLVCLVAGFYPWSLSIKTTE